MTQSQGNNVFISYSHTDKQWLARLKVHLKPLERGGVIDPWSDEKIHAGANWKEEIKKALKEAVVAVLLVSADFLASDFIDNDELPPLLAAAEKEDTVILPVIVSYSSFVENESLSKYQSVNPPDKPLEGMTKAEQDAVFYDVYKQILGIMRKREGRDCKKVGIESDKRKRAIEITDKVVMTDMQGYKGNADKRVQTEETDEGITIPKIRLRSYLVEKLSKDAVEIMIKDRGFYDSKLNPSGTGFPHKYELQKDGKVVFDHASGLMWQQSGSNTYISFKKAKAYVDSLNSQGFASYNDWRLPTLEESMSLMEPAKKNGKLYIDPKFDKRQEWIWTSDIPTGFWAARAWVVFFSTGYCYYYGCFDSDVYVRAVR